MYDSLTKDADVERFNKFLENSERKDSLIRFELNFKNWKQYTVFGMKVKFVSSKAKIKNVFRFHKKA